MKKIGTTLSGTVIVEMTADEFAYHRKTESVPAPQSDSKLDAGAMPHAELVKGVRDRLA